MGVVDEACEQATRAVTAGEHALADPNVRADPNRLRELLHPDFVEVGRSGARWTLDSIVDELAARPGAGYVPEALTVVPISDGVMLARWQLRGEDGRVASEHSTLWLWDPAAGAWRARYHQGTVVPPPPVTP